MYKSVVVVFLGLFLQFEISAQDLPAYRFYAANGKKSDFEKVANAGADAQVVLFGEFHNNPICHWLQLELTKSISAEKQIALGAEMFETDDQVVMDEYLNGFIKLDHLKKEAKIWPNFDTDYLPLVEFAKENQLPFIATNVPRRYASLLSKRGMAVLDSLSDQAKSFMPAIPFNVTENDSGYKDMKKMMGMHMQGGMSNFIAAQALKDYTMASMIFKHLPKDGVFIHYNGSFHSQKFAGIYNYLKAQDQNLKILTIAVVEADDVTSFDNDWKNLGNYILVLPTNMTKTH
jgi:uncharacterized iron-regulated protein